MVVMNAARARMDRAMGRMRLVRSRTSEALWDFSQPTAYNWVEYKTAKNRLIDTSDPNSFFFRAHTITVLVVLLLGLVYVALQTTIDDSEHNIRVGLLASLLFFLAASMVLLPAEGPFVRPHPALWRLALAASIVYELGLVFLLCQTAEDARRILGMLDSRLGAMEMDEKAYGGDCLLNYDNLMDKFDVFIWAHLFGYFCKTLIFRDWWFATVISIMFEFLEYSLEHQLPNFSECWWDHWILDVLICNGGGTLLGMLALNYLSMKNYNWRGLWTIPTYRGKIRRIIAQFSPHSWIEFEWRPLGSLERWLSVLCVIAAFLLTELSTFYLKFVLKWEPEHPINAIRLLGMLLWGAVAMRETFQLLDDPDCHNLGKQTWMLVAIIITEVLICLKFGYETITIPLPTHIVMGWLSGFALLVIYTLVRFVLFKPDNLPGPEATTIHINGKVANKPEFNVGDDDDDNDIDHDEDKKKLK